MCSDNCNNNGNCISYNNSYSCNCINNYIGKNCSKCNIGLINYRNKCVQCFKKSGYWGKFCQQCRCQHGICNDGYNGTGKCFCEKGWTGVNCNECENGYWKTALSVLIVIREFVIVVYWVQENVFVIKAIQV